jgi:hypothetical protein
MTLLAIQTDEVFDALKAALSLRLLQDDGFEFVC